MSTAGTVISWRLPEGSKDTMPRTRLRRSCRRRLKKLSVPHDVSLSALVEHLADHRERPIRLIACDVKAGEPSGKSEQYLDVDLVYYPRQTSSAHQAHIICHELAHLLCAHIPQFEALDDDLAPATLCRSHYAEPAEAEAEVLGTLLWQRLQLTDDDANIAVTASFEHRGSRHV